MQIVIISLVSILLFQGVLVVLSAVSTVFIELNSGFAILIDIASKAATIAVFLWAVHTFITQQKDKKREDKYARLKDLSYRLIDYVGRSDFALNKNSASILIAYLDTIIDEISQNEVAQEHLKEKKLAFDVTYETLKRTSLKEALGLDAPQKYNDIVDTITRVYSNSECLTAFDPEMLLTIRERSRKSTNMLMNIPSQSLQLWQILKILSLVLDQDEDIIEEELMREPICISDRHHQLPVLYAIYYVYSNGRFHIDSDDSFTFSTSGMTMACKRVNCL
ncbi:hypothetical protein CGT94_18430 [Vibrio metoecus]|uniref:hypothetical protein n=1 Tax=Vibrio metoecus TaxID=1481663 RepID=UPI0006D81690|nr:hypothetical protein [Vibrio metoecus]EGR5013354.1 hypothetical protein [Vibrio cholerae]EID7717333.1 hypothetical protein [Vibrio cholerae]EJL6329170.1 hypothetical protein [Vibrio cholerae]EJL6699276.1 hypothetical protein [Vibrio cholerae]EJL6771312.1 hypothetical protein [Vibrio cholerae]